jgi:O-acetyl-ADP-ribose deacetylase (regulator of RNase III)
MSHLLARLGDGLARPEIRGGLWAARVVPGWHAAVMAPLQFVMGDATSPQAAGSKVIAHVCNDLGGWGKGFVLAVSRCWPQPERDYRDWHRLRAENDFGLGAVRLVQVLPDVWVANMIGQHGIKRGSSGPPIRYDAVERCLTTLGAEAGRIGASVHMPRIGCGLAGGRWERIEPLVVTHLCQRGIAVTVYDFE